MILNDITGLEIILSTKFTESSSIKVNRINVIDIIVVNVDVVTKNDQYVSNMLYSSHIAKL
jgi:hypothetical protein